MSDKDYACLAFACASAKLLPNATYRAFTFPIISITINDDAVSQSLLGGSCIALDARYGESYVAIF